MACGVTFRDCPIVHDPSWHLCDGSVLQNSSNSSLNANGYEIRTTITPLLLRLLSWERPRKHVQKDKENAKGVTK
jgi:hypothetical protein